MSLILLLDDKSTEDECRSVHQPMQTVSLLFISEISFLIGIYLKRMNPLPIFDLKGYNYYSKTVDKSLVY